MEHSTGFRDAARAEVEARLAFRQAKARRFLELRRGGLGIQECWQRLAADDELNDLERVHLMAQVERTAAWIEATGSAVERDGNGGESDDHR